MLLGLVAASDAEGQHLVGLAAAAVQRGWEVRCFLTDQGVRLLSSTGLKALAASGAMTLTVCEHSWEKYGVGLPAGATLGSQYQNAELAHVCDRVIVF